MIQRIESPFIPAHGRRLALELLSTAGNAVVAGTKNNARVSIRRDYLLAGADSEFGSGLDSYVRILCCC